ncbi:hypothetical protein BIV25_33525 [Streptomyces sp. MUSC 14]|uniref:DUF6777 domain-containing protein n=1 Tax=Streptomyces sp. MUSC 14 TaxID=1354889 RepID=UPI0008F5C709|nr:DUF6777 domain-containing protein [Streptomyces sp. MUSC 14]OIJ89960.1 hypothetical protein BIV25_33525 [Streptomyces sp. MUSC 14]
MSVEPPSSDRPSGPPPGPLSGSSQPPSGPPAGPSGGVGGPKEPHGPWWKSIPRIGALSALSAVVVAAVVLAVVFTRSGGGSSAKGGEVFLQPAASAGQDPFTASTAERSSVPPPASASAVPSAPAGAVRGVQGGAPGLYGGTRNVAACDVEQQVRALQTDAAKTRAFASVAGVRPAGVPAYLRSLTPVQLRVDTRVTNHGYRDGAATSYQSVLQAGTAVLVDSHGVPRVRCACGNPLTSPVAEKNTPRLVGSRWPAYRSSNVVVVTPAPTVVDVFVLYDPHHDDWIHRPHGDQGWHHDRHTAPPKDPHPWNPPPSPSPSCPPGAQHCPSPSGRPSPSTPSPSPSVSVSSAPPSPTSSSPSASPTSSASPASPPTSPGTSSTTSPTTSPSPSPSSSPPASGASPESSPAGSPSSSPSAGPGSLSPSPS